MNDIDRLVVRIIIAACFSGALFKEAWQKFLLFAFLMLVLCVIAPVITGRR